MFTRRSLFAVVLCVSFLAGVQADEAAVKALQGKWSNDGADGLDATWTFTGDKLEANVNGNVYKAEVKADADAKPHSTLDVTITESPDGQGENRVGKAIYKLDGDKLTICVSMPGQDRPTEFSTIDEVQYKFELKKK
jgi:uncharacterized protein (TIGR03067 family)